MGKILPGIVLAFANSKGGSGKSMLTSVFAGYLNKFEKAHHLNITVIDADDAQNSLGKMRQRETSELDGVNKEDEYEIINISSSEIKNYIEYIDRDRKSVV